MPETDTETGFTPLEGRDLILAVKDILTHNPARHDQGSWIGNTYLTQEEINLYATEPVPVDPMKQYANRAIPDEPEDRNASWPACGSTGCVIGWAAVLSAPAGSDINGAHLVTPDGEWHILTEWVSEKMGISVRQAQYISNPYRDREWLIRVLDALLANPATDITKIELPG